MTTTGYDKLESLLDEAINNLAGNKQLEQILVNKLVLLRYATIRSHEAFKLESFCCFCGQLFAQSDNVKAPNDSKRNVNNQEEYVVELEEEEEKKEEEQSKQVAPPTYKCSFENNPWMDRSIESTTSNGNDTSQTDETCKNPNKRETQASSSAKSKVCRPSEPETIELNSSTEEIKEKKLKEEEEEKKRQKEIKEEILKHTLKIRELYQSLIRPLNRSPSPCNYYRDNYRGRGCPTFPRSASSRGHYTSYSERDTFRPRSRSRSPRQSRSITKSHHRSRSRSRSRSRRKSRSPVNHKRSRSRTPSRSSSVHKISHKSSISRYKSPPATYDSGENGYSKLYNTSYARHLEKRRKNSTRDLNDPHAIAPELVDLLSKDSQTKKSSDDNQFNVVEGSHDNGNDDDEDQSDDETSKTKPRFKKTPKRPGSSRT